MLDKYKLNKQIWIFEKPYLETVKESTIKTFS